MPYIPIAIDHNPQQLINCVDCRIISFEDFEKLGKELAIFIHAHTPGRFWDGVRNGCELLHEHRPTNEREARKCLFSKDQKGDDCEESCFEQ